MNGFKKYFVLDRKSSKNLLMYAAYQALRYLAPLVLTPFLADTLTKPRFADLVILNSCIWTSTVFMEFGFYLYGISKTAAAKGKDELSHTVTSISLAKAGLIPVALLTYLGLAAWAGLLFRDPTIVAIGALSAVGYGASYAWFFQGQQRGGTAVLTEAVPQFIYYAVVLLLVRKPDDLWLAALAQTIPPVTSLSVALTIVHRSRLFVRCELSAVWLVMREAFPYFVERFCFTLYTAIAPTLIAALSNSSEASYYSIGDRVGIFLATVPTPLFQAAIPYVTKRVRNDKGNWRLPVQLTVATTVAVGLISVTTFASVGWIIRRFFSSEYYSAIVIARLFCVNSVISVFGMACANFLIIPRNAASIMTVSSSTALVFGIISQLILVPRYGATGAVLSRVISETIVACVLSAAVVRMFVSSRKRYSVTLDLSESCSQDKQDDKDIVAPLG